MLETLHRIGSRIRHSRFLVGQGWFWEEVEPYWQKMFEKLSSRRGFSTRVNEDVFKLVYAFGARYDRYGHRIYEPVFYQAFVQEIKKGMTVFDIGAHIGLFTLGASKRVGPEGRVYAFEPSPESAEVLIQHISLNGWRDRVQVQREVVSDVEGVVPFFTHGLTMSASMARKNIEVLSPEKFSTPATMIRTTSVTLDKFCKAEDIKPDIMKIDAEGAELLILRGAKNLLMNGRPLILCEIHPAQMLNCRSSYAELMEYLNHIGYSVKPLDESHEKLGTFHSLITRKE